MRGDLYWEDRILSLFDSKFADFYSKRQVKQSQNTSHQTFLNHWTLNPGLMIEFTWIANIVLVYTLSSQSIHKETDFPVIIYLFVYIIQV